MFNLNLNTPIYDTICPASLVNKIQGAQWAMNIKIWRGGPALFVLIEQFGEVRDDRSEGNAQLVAARATRLRWSCPSNALCQCQVIECWAGLRPRMRTRLTAGRLSKAPSTTEYLMTPLHQRLSKCDASSPQLFGYMNTADMNDYCTHKLNKDVKYNNY